MARVHNKRSGVYSKLVNNGRIVVYVVDVASGSARGRDNRAVLLRTSDEAKMSLNVRFIQCRQYTIHMPHPYLPRIARSPICLISTPRRSRDGIVATICWQRRFIIAAFNAEIAVWSARLPVRLTASSYQDEWPTAFALPSRFLF